MLHLTARSAKWLAGRSPAQRFVGCAAPGYLAIGTRSLQQPQLRSFWAALPRQEHRKGKEVGDGRQALSETEFDDEFLATSQGDNDDNGPAFLASTSPTATTLSSSSDLPWYLKVDMPKHATLVPAEVVLPEIPEGAPGLMQPLLTFAADDLGLDELRLLDLRQLEPAAALGPDLMMVFGTARSERHLHVSADRLVRWLRRYGIHATADGLLGRNELKIKLRRKARRAKLLGSNAFAGLGGDGTSSMNVDDGISTQWVCLNVGTLGRTGEEGSVVDADGRTTGFGAVTRTGTTVVVQMFTEAKRQQLDLETLWSRTLSRCLRRKAEEEGERDSSSFTGRQHLGQQHQQQQQQRRFFFTSARRLAVSSGDVLARLTRPSLEAVDLGEIEQQLFDVRTSAGASTSANSMVRVRLLHKLAQYLQRLPRTEVMEALSRSGSESRDREKTRDGNAATQTQFLRTAAYCMRGLPAAETWAFRSAVHATALRAGHAGYGLEALVALVREMQRTGADLPREHALQLLRAAFSVWGPLVEADETTARQQIDVAQAVVDTLHERGQAVLAGDVLVTVVAALARANRKEADQNRGVCRADRLQQGLEELLRELARAGRLPCPDEAQVAALLSAYAAQGDWTRFWDAWRLRPQHGQSRSARLYAHVFGQVARTLQRSRCEQALRWCFHEMAYEQPPVRPTGAVLHAMRACIRVVDPQAEALARNLVLAAKDGGSEFVRLLKAAEGITAVQEGDGANADIDLFHFHHHHHCHHYDRDLCFTMTVEAPSTDCPRCSWLPELQTCPPQTAVTTLTVPCYTKCCPTTPTVTVTTPCPTCSTTCGIDWEVTVVVPDCPVTSAAAAPATLSDWERPPPRPTQPARTADDDDSWMAHNRLQNRELTIGHTWVWSRTKQLDATTTVATNNFYNVTKTIVWPVPRDTAIGHGGRADSQEQQQRPRAPRRIQLRGYGSDESAPTETAEVELAE